MRNGDISHDLIMSQELNFEAEIMKDHRNNAATTIQRWFKNLLEKRLLKEAEANIAMTKNLLRYRDLTKQKLVKQHIEGRESVDVGELWGFKHSQKENFSVFNNKNIGAENVSLYGSSKGDGYSSKVQEYKPSPINESNSKVPKEEVKAKMEEQEEDEDNKLQALNELLRNKEFQIKKQDEEDFELFMKKMIETKQSSQKKSTINDSESKVTVQKPILSEQNQESSVLNEEPFLVD